MARSTAAKAMPVVFTAVEIRLHLVFASTTAAT